MNTIHTEILTKEQEKLLPLLKDFSKDYYLVGGTAIALHIGHRKSIDFDLFTGKKVFPKIIRNKIQRKFKIDAILYEEEGQAHYIVNKVKVTFYNYPFEIVPKEKIFKYIKIPDLLTLSAMKVFAISERNKWKDYVDLYYIFKKYYTVAEVLKKANKLFPEYNDKMFFEQITYFNDIDYSEKIEYLNESPDDEKIKNFLKNLTIQKF